MRTRPCEAIGTFRLGGQQTLPSKLRRAQSRKSRKLNGRLKNKLLISPTECLPIDQVQNVFGNIKRRLADQADTFDRFEAIHDDPVR